MAAFEVLALDPTTPQIRAPGAADTYSFPRNVSGNITLASGGVFQVPQANRMFGSTNSGSAGFGMSSNLPVLLHGNSATEGVQINNNGAFSAVIAADAANTLAQRNGVNPQTFNIYNTFTTVSDYERATIAWDTNVCYFAYENGGTGNANRQLRFGARGTTNWFEYSANNGLNVTWSSSTNFSRTRWLNGNIQFDIGTVTSFLGLNTSGTSRLTLADAVNIEVNTTTGTKIGTATSQKLGFWNATPIVQPTTAVAAATVAATGVGDVVAASTTFDGYTIPQIVKALRNAGLLA